MGAGSSSLTGGFDFGGMDDTDRTFGMYGINTQPCIPISTEGVSLKMTDSTKQTVYDLVTTKSASENVLLEEYLTKGEKDHFYKNRDFVIVGNELRAALRNLDLLDSDMRFENTPRLKELQCLEQFPKFEYKAMKNPVIAEFVSFIKQSCPIFNKMDETFATGIIPSATMGYYFKLGSKVAIFHEGVIQGAYINKVVGSSIKCQTLSQNRFGKYTKCIISIDLKEESYTLEKLHKKIRPLIVGEPLYQTLAKRGADIVSSKGKVQYLSYTGPIFAGSGVLIGYENNIRVVLDLYNDIPKSHEEKLDSIGSRDKQIDSPTESQLFAVLGCVPVYHIEKQEHISVVFDNLQQIQFNENYFDELVLDKKYKDFLSLVTNNNVSGSTQIDTIKGKGSGLLFILAGAPGLGKTMTVEALAEKNHIPLIVVNFGTLGITPNTVENSLKYIMQLAEYWNAILLFDEADVFLEYRTNSSDIARNAIVGVFLQALEYHKGVIFLTTNRETSLDPAIISRSILRIQYRTLTHDQSLIIWRNMLSRVTNKVDTIIHKLQQKYEIGFNGRDIRNIIHMATILSNGQELDCEHIEQALSLHSN